MSLKGHAVHPVHFQFVSTSPFQDRYTVQRLFELLDSFDMTSRDLILRSAYRSFDLGNNEGYPQASFKEDMYRDFKAAFERAAMQLPTEEDSTWREEYVVFGLVSYLLVEALHGSELGVYEQFKFNNREQLRQCNEALQGDDSSRTRAMEWSVKAIKQLDHIDHVKLSRRLAYRSFCNNVVEPLLKGDEE